MTPYPPIPESHPPIRSLGDIETIERTPLEERIWSWNVNDWIRRGWSADPARIAIHFLENADPHETAVSVSHGELRRKSNQAANLFRSLGVGPEDAVLILLPTVPELFYAQFGGLAAGIACCVNWMLKPSQLLDLVRNARTKLLIASDAALGYEIWENVQSIRSQLPSSVRVLGVGEFNRLCVGQPDELVFERD